MPNPSNSIQALVGKGSLVSLAETLAALRSQLQDAYLIHLEESAKAKALGTNLISFGLAEVTASFELVASSSLVGDAKLSFWVVSAETQGKLDSTVKHSITLKLHVTGPEKEGEIVLGNTKRSKATASPVKRRRREPTA